MAEHTQQGDLVDGMLERLYTGSVWAEGPVWIPSSGTVRWSDIPNNRILEFDAATAAAREYATGVEYTNGRVLDHDGSVVQCSHGRRRVERDREGTVTPVVDSFEGHRLNSPNDVVVKSDGSVWFTDPTFGILGYYEGEKDAPQLQPAVYRIDGQTGEASVATNEVEGPNGLAFSPDESKLYVVASRAQPHRLIMVYDVVGGAKLENGRVFIDAGPGGSPDGFRVDIHGNLWCGWGTGSDELDGVRIFNPSGRPIGHISLPERSANVCFGGRWRNRLFMAASHSLYALYVNTQGAAGG